jgi:hypothetical protein
VAGRTRDNFARNAAVKNRLQLLNNSAHPLSRLFAGSVERCFPLAPGSAVLAALKCESASQSDLHGDLHDEIDTHQHQGAGRFRSFKPVGMIQALFLSVNCP